MKSGIALQREIGYRENTESGSKRNIDVFIVDDIQFIICIVSDDADYFQYGKTYACDDAGYFLNGITFLLVMMQVT